MPVQRVLFGRPIPHITPRRMVALLGTIALFAVFTLVFTLPNAIPEGPSLGKFAETKITLPKLPTKLPGPGKLNPFRPVAHAPPVQKNSTNGESSWHSTWNWLNPFSSSVTLDENRSLLPPLPERPAIYTYYDNTVKKDQELKDAENALLITWRRAWWAHGFRPVILSPAEAMNNPLYEQMQKLKLSEELTVELSRWLAWENMGTGMLCNYLTLPMGRQEDHLLSYLRRGEYPKLTRFEHLGDGLFVGSKADITAALKGAFENDELANAKDLISAMPKKAFSLDPFPEALAFYDVKAITEKYPKVAQEIAAAKGKGLQLLNQLIVSHLHNTWQNSFPKGIAVLKPLPEHTTSLVAPALQLANFLAQCPISPMPSSCPPNQQNCRPCVASHPMKVSTPGYYRNNSDLYTIGTVPHPYTFATMTGFRETVDITWIRRESERDPWITTLTKELAGTGASTAPRVLKFKEAVASQLGASHSLWLIAEKEIPNDLDWYFGFAIPRNMTDTGKSETPVPGPERRPKPVHDPKDGPIPAEEQNEMEQVILKKAKDIAKKRTPEEQAITGAIEAWNLGDTEAWKFARAYLARASMERSNWQDEEKKYAGGAGSEKGSGAGWGRWFDD
ncbi:hypothetical protein F5884DRAFT_854893 [Xylogone sp. PMI_703]|nr:hypothetical protein F5884DRAFT_854893 [Xylogone sp. PMI_703]